MGVKLPAVSPRMALTLGGVLSIGNLRWVGLGNLFLARGGGEFGEFDCEMAIV
jgi:hypothetical protein